MLLNRKRFFACFAVITLVSLSFWLGSRYPDLNAKAMMAASGSVADTVSMWPIFEVKESDPTYRKIALSTINWTNDNKKGMLFGVVLGALFLTLIGYLQIKERRSRFLDSFYGFLLGSPLGVCVNCAAPVFKGVLQSNRAELAFAMMLSSPTMNFVVLTMVFSLFPWYMAIVKVLFTLIAIFLAIPLLSMLLGDEHRLRDAIAVKGPKQIVASHRLVPVDEQWVEAVLGFCKDLFANFRFIASKTVPLMFVAGLLGASLSHLIPLESLMGVRGVAAVILVAIVGTILPVPVAFDVVLTNALFTAGLGPDLVLVLLCSLGIFSIYSYFIVWRSASPAWASGIAIVVVCTSAAIGFVGDALHQVFYVEKNISAFAMSKVNEMRTLSARPLVGDQSNKPRNYGAITTPIVTSVEGAKITEWPRHEKAKENKGAFKKIEGQALGLVEGFTYQISDYPDPFWVGRGTASADWNKDGYDDIAFGSDKGVLFYENVGGRFVSRDFRLPRNLRVYAIAFADFNQDGWVDLFFTTFMKGNFIAFNSKGSFDADLIKVPNGDGVLTIAPAINDLDGDGFLDIFNGNMALGVATGFHRFEKGRQNSITWGGPNLTFTQTSLSAKDGETMSSHIADFDQDGDLDIYASEDFIVPDRIYLNEGKRRFEIWQNDLISSPYFSMSIDTGDFNNDLKIDWVSTGTTAPKKGLPAHIDGLNQEQYGTTDDSVKDCDEIESEHYRQNCINNRAVKRLIDFDNDIRLEITDCEKISSHNQRQDCFLSIMWTIVTRHRISEDCGDAFKGHSDLIAVCNLMKRKTKPYVKSDFKAGLNQVNRAVLMMNLGEGKLLDASKQGQAFDHPGGWTWSTKIADFDNDGWQDIFNAEGAVRKGVFGFNTLMHNQNVKGFTQKQFSWNLDDPHGLYSFTVFDFDRDGDLDIIGNSALGPIQVYENQLNDNTMLSLRFWQPGKNSALLGKLIEITLPDGSKQVREIKIGGGYQSSTSSAVHFGLGQLDPDEKIQITLRDPNKKIELFQTALKAGTYEVELD